MTIYGGDGKNWGKAAGGSTLIKTVNPFLIMEYSAKGYRHSVVKIGCEYVHIFRVPSCLLLLMIGQIVRKGREDGNSNR